MKLFIVRIDGTTLTTPAQLKALRETEGQAEGSVWVPAFATDAVKAYETVRNWKLKWAPVQYEEWQLGGETVSALIQHCA